jgi:hypothetical protein
MTKAKVRRSGRVRRFSYITPHRRGMLHIATKKHGDGERLQCGRRMAAGWQYAMAQSGIPKCSQCQGTMLL